MGLVVAESSVGGIVAALLVTVAGVLVLWWAVWSLATRRGRERLRESQARSRARRQTSVVGLEYPPQDSRFEPTRGTSLQDYAAHLYFAHTEDLARLGVDRERIPLERKWLFEVHGRCHAEPW